MDRFETRLRQRRFFRRTLFFLTVTLAAAALAIPRIPDLPNSSSELATPTFIPKPTLESTRIFIDTEAARRQRLLHEQDPIPTRSPEPSSILKGEDPYRNSLLNIPTPIVGN